MSFLKSIVNGVQAWTGIHSELSKALAPIDGQWNMIMNLRKLFDNPHAAIARIDEFREWVKTLNRLVGPELRKIIEYHDFPFSTMEDILKNGDRLMNGINIIMETVAKLQELGDQLSN